MVYNRYPPELQQFFDVNSLKKKKFKMPRYKTDDFELKVFKEEEKR